MYQIPMNSKGSLNHNTIFSLNTGKIRGAKNSTDIHTLNQNDRPNPASAPNPLPPAGNAAHRPKAVFPALRNPIQKGQKETLAPLGQIHQLRAGFGFQCLDSRCDVDVSAFLLGSDGKVLGDGWFVFYGQAKSPDHSVQFCQTGALDPEEITIDLDRLHPDIKKIVFVLTIHEAFDKGLHFGMIDNAYVRLFSFGNSLELISFKMTDYYANVISMMIGEIYLHNGNWKFHAIGNGMAKDLAGLCEWYGVETV